MKTLIKNIASIQTGLFIKPDREGTILYLQVKHFDENGHLNEELHPDLKEYNVNPKYILQSGDILFAAKGSNNFAACYRNEEQPAVASTTFFVIRIMDKHILPEYLTWYINQPKSMDFLKGKAIGTSIPSISKAVLGELEVSIPSLHSQRIILELINLKNIERGLLSKIETLREQLFQQQIINALN